MSQNLLNIYYAFINSVKQRINRKPEKEKIFKEIHFSSFPLSYYEETPRRFGVKISGTSLIISNEARNDILLGVIARESLIPFLPKSVEELDEKYDLALEFGRQALKKDEKWIEIWKKCSKPLVKGHFYYDAPSQIPAMTRATRNKFLWSFLSMLHTFSDYGFKLTVDEYLEIYTDHKSRMVPRLSEIEVNVLRNISTLGTIDRSKLQKNLKLSPSRVSGLINDLKRKQIIYQTVSVDFSKLGFTSYYIYYSGPKEDGLELIEKTYNKSKYKFSLHFFADGEFSFLATFLAPIDMRFSNRFFEKCFRLRKRISGNILCFQRHPDYSFSFHNYNFSKYDTKNKEWKINWVLWYLGFKRALGRSDTLPVYNILVNPARFNLKILTRNDLKIIEYVLVYKNLNRRKIRNYLKINMNELNNRIKILEDCGIIKPQIYMWNLGLPEYVSLIVRSESLEFLNLLKIMLDDLPYNGFDVITGVFDELQSFNPNVPNGAISFIGVPSGDSSILKKYLRELLKDYTALIHTSTLSKSSVWTIPIDDWDDEKKEWKINDI